MHSLGQTEILSLIRREIVFLKDYTRRVFSLTVEDITILRRDKSQHLCCETKLLKIHSIYYNA